MTSSLDILELVYSALLDATDAQDRVYRPGDWPSQPETLPQLKLRLVSEDRQSIARSGPPEFITTATIRAVGQVQAPADNDDAGAGAAEQLLWTLKRQADVAVINSYPLTSEIQQIASVRSQLAFSAESAVHLAAIQIDFAIEFYEGPESFAPVQSDDLDELDLSASNYPPTATTVSLT